MRSIFLSFLTTSALLAYPEPTPETEANRTLQRYWDIRTAEIEQTGSLGPIASAEAWKARAPKAREELFEMLGLSPLPQRTDLKPVITGTETVEDVRIEKLHFQSMPGLYVTANFYRPVAEPKASLPNQFSMSAVMRW